jgi:hypothetical protein
MEIPDEFRELIELSIALKVKISNISKYDNTKGYITQFDGKILHHIE